MAVADDIGLRDPRARQREARLRVAGAERPDPLDLFLERAGGAGRRQHRVDPQGADRAGRGDRALDPFAQVAVQRLDPARFHGQPGRHPVAAAVPQQAGLARGDHGSAQVDAGDRAAGALADAVRQRDHAGRPGGPLDDAGRDDADDAGMPALAGDEHQRQPFGRLRLRLLQRGSQHRPFDGPAFGVEAVEPFGEPARFGRIVRRQQLRTEIGPADPPAGIDPRPQHEAGMVGARRRGQPRHVGQRRQADVTPARHDREAAGDQRPVEAGQRHDIAHRTQRHEVEQRHQIGLRPVLEPAPPAQRPVERDQQQEGHADRGKRLVRAVLVQPVRVHHRDRRRQRRFGDMVVEHHDIEARGLRSRQRFVGRDAAIDRQHQADALAMQAQQGFGIGAVPFGDPVGHIEAQGHAQIGEIAVQQGGGGCAVDIVIAEHGHRFAVFQGGGDPLNSGVHVLEMGRVGQRAFQARLEKVPGAVRRLAAIRKQAADDFRQAEPLRHRHAEPLVGRRIARAARLPAPAAERPLDSQNRG